MSVDFDRTAAFAKVERRDLVDSVIKQIVEVITSGNYKEGERLPTERELAETLGVGRSTIREALKSLTIIGIIEGKQGGGTFVRHLDDMSFMDKALSLGLLRFNNQIDSIVEARELIDIKVAELAATRHRKSDLGKLESIIKQMHESNETTEFSNLDLAFHAALADAAHNPVLKYMVTAIQPLVLTWMARVYKGNNTIIPEKILEHEHILAAVKKGDSEGAAKAMRAHLEKAAERLKKAL